MRRSYKTGGANGEGKEETVSAFARIDPHNAAVPAEPLPYVRPDNISASLVSMEKELSGTCRGISPDRTRDGKLRVVDLEASAR